MARLKDISWSCGEKLADGSVQSTDIHHAQLAVLQDIRDELKQLNRVFACQNFTWMPHNIERTRKAIEGLRRDLKKKSNRRRDGFHAVPLKKGTR